MFLSKPGRHAGRRGGSADEQRSVESWRKRTSTRWDSQRDACAWQVVVPLLWPDVHHRRVVVFGPPQDQARIENPTALRSATKELASPKVSNDKGLPDATSSNTPAERGSGKTAPQPGSSKDSPEREGGPSDRDLAKALSAPSSRSPQVGSPSREPHSSSRDPLDKSGSGVDPKQQRSPQGDHSRFIDPDQRDKSKDKPERDAETTSVARKANPTSPSSKDNQHKKGDDHLQPNILYRPKLQSTKFREEPPTSHGRKRLAPMGHQDDLSATCQVQVAMVQK